MSHFVVLVIGDNVDLQLAPFNENFGRIDWVARYNNLVDRMREKMRRELGVVEYVEAGE